MNLTKQNRYPLCMDAQMGGYIENIEILCFIKSTKWRQEIISNLNLFIKKIRMGAIDYAATYR